MGRKLSKRACYTSFDQSCALDASKILVKPAKKERKSFSRTQKKAVELTAMRSNLIVGKWSWGPFYWRVNLSMTT